MKRSTKLIICVATIFFMLLTASSALAGFRTVTLVPSKDNTIYEELAERNGEPGTLCFGSNGQGMHFFAGLTRPDRPTDPTRGPEGPFIRRTLVAFDIARHIPPGAIIISARLTSHMSRNVHAHNFDDFKLYKVLKDWGEGASDAANNRSREGAGACAEDDDATWENTFFPDEEWVNPGGDFSSKVSAAATLGGWGRGVEAFYVWGSTFQMNKDVKSWLNDPDNNFGWILIGPEGGGHSARRFDSRENAEVSFRPTLTIVYIP